MQVSMSINGQTYSHDIEPRLLLVHYIREYAELHGTHWGCDTSNCGICIVLMDGEPINKRDQRPVYSERFIHSEIYNARPDVNAVVHAHPTYSTILAIMGMEIPPVHYMIAAAGGDSIRCAPYATFGTEELSEHAVRALEGRLACLLDHHGMTAVGKTLDKAMWLAVEVETLARQYHGCLQIGKPPLLSSAEIERVRGRMAGYGVSDG